MTILNSPGYGPSETTNICTARKVSIGDSSQYLGWSFENTSSFVFYPDCDEIAPVGCLGELCFGGDQVAAGYLNMPEVTASKFFRHPRHGRLYRSGDLGRMLPDGSLIILGRLDSQVKLRGQRIELEEIHSLVLGSGMAKACTSTLLNHRSLKSQQLALYYVPVSEEGQKLGLLPLTTKLREESQALMQTLKDALPTYMIPSFIVPISVLPLTSSGKVDIGYLCRATEVLTDEVLDQYSPSTDVGDDLTKWTETEACIAIALAETLEVDKRLISRWGSFAAVGLDSISAMPFARHLRDTFHKRIPISQILQNPSIGRLAQSIAADKMPQAPTGKHSIFPPELAKRVSQPFADQGVLVENVLPCTPLQEAMLASSASSADSASYCNQMMFCLRHAPEEIIAYWDEMCLRHEILRTCFVTTEDPNYPLAQVVLKSAPLSWSRLETSDLQRCAFEHLNSLVYPSAIMHCTMASPSLLFSPKLRHSL
jgi:acyl carrier protein